MDYTLVIESLLTSSSSSSQLVGWQESILLANISSELFVDVRSFIICEPNNRQCSQRKLYVTGPAKVGYICAQNLA